MNNETKDPFSEYEQPNVIVTCESFESAKAFLKEAYSRGYTGRWDILNEPSIWNGLKK